VCVRTRAAGPHVCALFPSITRPRLPDAGQSAEIVKMMAALVRGCTAALAGCYSLKFCRRCGIRFIDTIEGP